MRRLKHDPELVAWGEAYRNDDDQTIWVSESIYSLWNKSSIDVIDGADFPLGQYIIKIFYALPDDSVYISGREFTLTNGLIYDSYYDCDNIYDSFNGEKIPFGIAYYGHPETNQIVCNINAAFAAPGEDEVGNLTYKLWRIA